jgi:hypothetical protein
MLFFKPLPLPVAAFATLVTSRLARHYPSFSSTTMGREDCSKLPYSYIPSAAFRVFGKCPPTLLGVGICLIFGLFVSSRFRSHKPLPFQQVILPTVLKVTNNFNNYRQIISAQSDSRNFQPTISVTHLSSDYAAIATAWTWDRRSRPSGSTVGS